MGYVPHIPSRKTYFQNLSDTISLAQVVCINWCRTPDRLVLIGSRTGHSFVGSTTCARDTHHTKSDTLSFDFRSKCLPFDQLGPFVEISFPLQKMIN